MQKGLASGLTGRLHLSHRLVSYEEIRNEVHLSFQDGSSAVCDLLIGIDGINSVVRKCFLGKRGLLSSPSFNPVRTGSFAYRGLILVDEIEKEFSGHRAITMPVMVRIFVINESVELTFSMLVYRKIKGLVIFY